LGVKIANIASIVPSMTVGCFETKERMRMALDCESIAGIVAGGHMAFDPSIGRGTQWRNGQPSPNPGGRPRTRVLSEALRAQLGEIKPDDPAGRTYAEIVAANLIDTEGPGAVHAASEIADRLEGRARQQVEIADFTADLRSRSDAELQFYLDNDRWPSDEEKVLLLSGPADAPTA